MWVWAFQCCNYCYGKYICKCVCVCVCACVCVWVWVCVPSCKIGIWLRLGWQKHQSHRQSSEESNPTYIWHWSFSWSWAGNSQAPRSPCNFFAFFAGPPKDRSYFTARYAEAMGIKLRSQQEGPGGPTLSGLGYKQDLNHCTQTTPHYISHSSQLRI